MKLKDYIEEFGVSNSWFAKKLGIATTTLWAWITERRAPPKSAVMIIETLTNGKVCSSDWHEVKIYQKGRKLEKSNNINGKDKNGRI